MFTAAFPSCLQLSVETGAVMNIKKIIQPEWKAIKVNFKIFCLEQTKLVKNYRLGTWRGSKKTLGCTILIVFSLHQKPVKKT